MDIPVSSTTKELKRVLGVLAYYSKWIRNLLTKIELLPETATFPLPKESVQMFKQLRKELTEVTLMAIDENKSFVVETDASQEALSATLNQKEDQ